MIRRKHNKGNSLVELVLLVPLYLLILLGMLCIGDLTGIRTRLRSAAEQAAALPYAPLDTSAVEAQLFSLYPEGDLVELTLDEGTPAPFPPPGEIRRIIEILVDPPGKPWASGSWEFVDGELVPVVTTGQSQRPAQLADRHLDDDEPDLLETTMQDYMHEVSAKARFSYDPDYIRIGPPLNLNPITLGQDLTARQTTCARGDLEREVAGDGSGHPIEPLVELMPNGRPMPHFPGFMQYHRSFWRPDRERRP
ncbi:MAG: pilus assembly protein [Planctomycetes bacterium]|nr:pilus assembly protein [Planctomycetota bacterium]